MNLERELRALAVDWPRTPDLVLALAPPPRRRRRPLLAALAVGLVALTAAFAVPQSRGAILRLLHLGGESIEFVETLPPAESRALDAGLGTPVSEAEARVLVPALLLPPVAGRVPLRRSGEVVSLVFLHRGKPVLLSELTSGQGSFLKKLAGTGSAEWVNVRGSSGLWLSGAPHVFFFPHEPPRLAGSTLVWATESTTYRLEGPGLSREDALALARSLRKYPVKG
jgi:hypothetical protein